MTRVIWKLIKDKVVMSSCTILLNQAFLSFIYFYFFVFMLFCSLFLPFWSWILSILTLDFLIVMLLMIELPLKVLKLH